MKYGPPSARSRTAITVSTVLAQAPPHSDGKPRRGGRRALRSTAWPRAQKTPPPARPPTGTPRLCGDKSPWRPVFTSADEGKFWKDAFAAPVQL